jgi:nitrile hydratase accessory protein
VTRPLPALGTEPALGAPPRSNGELVFEEPWESRAFGVAVALHHAGVLDFESFRARLIEEIGEWEGEGYRYYERWLTALERTVLTEDVVDSTELDAAREATEHDWDHGH